MQESVIHSKVLGNCANDFDVLVRIVSTTDSITATHQWLYNRRSELVGASGTQTHPYDYAYSYDSIGNRLTSSDDSGIATYVANSLNQYTAVNRTIDQSVQSNNFTYDADGNLTQDDRFNYAYDDENRLVSVMPRNPSVGSLAIENAYDHRNRRIRKVVKSYDGSSWNVTETSLFIWDGWNLIHERVDYTNGTTDEFDYYWGRDLSGSLQGAGGVGGLLYVKCNGVIYVPHTDANGNILRYTDTAGNIVAAYTYDAFGRTIAQSGSLADVFRHRFSSKYFDVETGLYYYGYRFYSPVLLRWLNRDPIEEEGGANLYAICNNSLMNQYDSFGLKSKSQCVRNGVPIFLVFDGQALSGSGFYVVAASGRPISSIKTVWTSKEKFPWGSIYGGIITEYSFDYSVDKQKIKSVGPTPEGNYWIEVNEQRNYRTSKYSHIVLRKGWGDYSWSLHPEASTQTYGRSGFFIHGGENWGSAGCIDIKSGDRQLKTFLDGLCDCYVPVKVKYSVKSNKLSEKETTWINVPSPQGYPFVR